LRDLGDVVGMPRVITESGQSAFVMFGTEMPVGSLNQVTYRHVGHKIAVVPRLGEDGKILLDFEQRYSRLASNRLIPTPGGAQPAIEWVAAKSVARVAEGETLLIGGLARQASIKQTLTVPLASRLPVIGSWFHFSWQREIDEEIVVLITPRHVAEQAAPR
jgi:type IV pilus assembly protein PilQ